jgi:CRISPR/Cas system-associated exonuclease Cas4 (RecB family)
VERYIFSYYLSIKALFPFFPNFTVQSYQQCPQAYRFRYERGLKSPAAFGSAELGNALHRALAIAYKDGHCDRCGFAKYCAAKTDKPEPLPESGQKLKLVQLALQI